MTPVRFRRVEWVKPENQHQETYSGDSAHEIYDAGLRGGAELHRFLRKLPGLGRVRHSAIYIGNEEIWAQVREGEVEMLKNWNDFGCDKWQDYKLNGM